jgi:23S rRNA pseudouridine955/2504/2580 synthase
VTGLKILTVGENDAGQRLDRFLTKTVPNVPKSLLYKSIRQKDIKLNGKRAHIDDRLNAGDEVAVYLRDELLMPPEVFYDFLKAPARLDVVYEDENILLLDKPQGILVHPDENYETDTLLSRMLRYLYEKGEYDPKRENAFAPAFANRIDRGTGGIVLAAKNAEALRVLNDKLRTREIDKFYLCLVHGTPPKRGDTLTGYLFKDAVKNRVYIHNTKRPGDSEIRTKYRVLALSDEVALLEVQLLTGRTHQIRAHLAFIGCPLVGDGKYGKNADDKKRGYNTQALYSYKLTFSFAGEETLLSYLNRRTFAAGDVWFAKEFLK